MKPFDELTHSELIALTEEQIQYYIDRECAEAGVPLLPPTAPQPVTIPTIEKSVTHYLVAGLRVADRDEAERLNIHVIGLKSRRSVSYLGTRYSYRDPTHDAPDETEYGVTIERVFTADEAARQKAENDRLGDRKAAYDKAKKEYDAAVSGRQTYADNIRRTVDDAYSLERRRESLLAEYQRYLPIANGDETVAKRFLARAHRDAIDVLPWLFDGVALDPRPPVEVAHEEEAVQF